MARQMTNLSTADIGMLSHLVLAIDAWEKRTEAEGFGGPVTSQAAQEARDSLPRLLFDNSHLSPEQLENIAEKLSPGFGYDSGWLARLIYETFPLADPLVLAATIRWNWWDSKIGFPFLPDPAILDTETYVESATLLYDMLLAATDYEPRRILTGEDREFFDGLPNHFVVYRGCSGISAAKAAAGLCWTLGRDWANWFAGGSRGSPIVLMARVRKSDLAFAIASEREVVVQPRHVWQVKWHEQSKRPDLVSRSKLG